MLRKRLLGPTLLALLTAFFGFETATVSAAPADPAVVSVFGVGNVQGERAIVHVLFLVGANENRSTVAEEVLRSQGARPFTSADYSLTGLAWDQFSDDNLLNDFVAQYLNPAGQPSSVLSSALTDAQATWTDVTSSRFAFSYAGTTNRCPSLVRECPGAQVFDGFNDVGWLRLDPRTLGVTWFSTSIDEADFVWNTRFRWDDTCTNIARTYDARTVGLHELGHVAGLGHSNVDGAVMEPVYEGAHCNLSQDDINGLSNLYPN